jgi:hypothetical protein
MCNRIRFQPVDRHKYIFVFQRRVFLEEISDEQHKRFWAHPIMCLEAINIAFFSTPVDSFIRKSSIDETIPEDFLDGKWHAGSGVWRLPRWIGVIGMWGRLALSH